MKIITSFFILVTLALSAWIWDISRDTRLVNNRIKNTEEEISSIEQEAKSLVKYKDEPSFPLDKFYLDVFNSIKEICSYYNANLEIKIIEAKDFVNTEEFFKPSQYKGIRYLDILCLAGLKDSSDTYLFEMLYKIIKNRPIETLEVKIEKNTLNLTMRLYGP